MYNFIGDTSPKKTIFFKKMFKTDCSIFASHSTKLWPCVLGEEAQDEGRMERTTEGRKWARKQEVVRWKRGREGGGGEDAGASSSDLPNAGSPRRTKAD